jgi:hypothetical protein
MPRHLGCSRHTARLQHHDKGDKTIRSVHGDTFKKRVSLLEQLSTRRKIPKGE